ncbi:site-specific DNA-methyltransferase [bacterium]|nr:site-specific DNA-methyltransferase [bacterium]
MDGKSLSISEDKLNQLKNILPEAFTEDKIDWEKLKAALGDNIEFKNERYVLNWAGKSDAFRVLQEQTTATLIPNKEESIDFDDTENIFIEGENLEVLKVLQKSYYGKIKMIYIDPPYNTGNDFVYSDKFQEDRRDYEKRAGIKDENGYLKREGLIKNTKDKGHYHSNWLSMIYPRLFLARNLLRDDGVIFVSIGQNEIGNLLILCNEIFGEENKIGIITRLMKKGGSKGKYFSPNTEYILVYSRNIEQVKDFRLSLERDFIDKIYTQIEKDGNNKGERFREMGLYQAGLDIRANQRYWIKCPDGTYVIPPGRTIPQKVSEGEQIKPEKGDGVWRWTYDRYKQEFLLNNISFKETKTSSLQNGNSKQSKWNIYTKIWLKNRIKEGRVPVDYIDKFENRISSRELKKINIPFDFAKPSELIKHLIKISQINENNIILDFFAGSGTTAHAVLDLNKEDSGNRKFILVQMPEKTDEMSEAYKAGYKTIAEIGKERIRRVIKKIREETPKKELKNSDLGFKVFKLRESNFKIWRSNNVNDEETLIKLMEDHIDPVKDGSKIENILYELLLKSGIELTTKIEKKSGYYSANNKKIIFILEKIDENIIQDILLQKPKKVITLDRLFKNNDQLKTNTALQMKDAEIDFEVV